MSSNLPAIQNIDLSLLVPQNNHDLAAMEDIGAVTKTAMGEVSRINQEYFMCLLEVFKSWRASYEMTKEWNDPATLEALEIAKKNSYAILHQANAAAGQLYIEMIVRLKEEYLKSPNKNAKKIGFLDRLIAFFSNR